MGDVGARLREARERKGISLKEIAGATKISLHSLQALERNDASRLPGGIFSRAFVRSYALEVGLDPDEILKEYLAQTSGDSSARLGVFHAPTTSYGPGTDVPGLVADEAVFESQQRMATVVLKLVVISLAVGATILYVTLPVGAPEGATESGPTVPGGGAAAVSGAPGSGEAGRPVAEEPTVGDPSAAVKPADAQAAATMSNVSRADLPVPLADASPAGPPRAELALAPPVRLEIGPTRECWVRLTADGQVVLSRVLAPGEREAHMFRESAVLQVGDAEACALSINGRPARALGNPRQVRQVVLTRDNYREFLP